MVGEKEDEQYPDDERHAEEVGLDVSIGIVPFILGKMRAKNF